MYKVVGLETKARGCAQCHTKNGTGDLPAESGFSIVRSLHYDLVLNGCEVGGGSVRIHDPLLQGQVLDYLGVDRISLQHLLDALSSGCPPHAGIALGLDRLLSLICHAASIRDVIAFPKTLEGRDPMSGAPVPISEQDQKLYHIRSLEPMDDTCVESAQ
uniref:Aminoacyl-tRNA synthetase class II (D/K/N) domain-containing protein n=1 Tax=Timema cristinae TaxID=61476 RepID=A0A7R9DHL4_TIMCR|nr:unnamed protein product [Timema cristinae]